jgi:hypothetical protein
MATNGMVDQATSVIDVPVLATEPSAASLGLDQNVPNPVRDQTRIAFRLPAPAWTELAVYTPSGRRVRSLIRGPRAAGGQAVEWDGRDSANRRVAAGVYFYRLRASGNVLSRKLVVEP